MRNTIAVDILIFKPGTSDEINEVLLRVDKYDPTDIREARAQISMADAMRIGCEDLHLQSDVINWCNGTFVEWIDNQVYYSLKNLPPVEMDVEKENENPASWER
jgi:hypothetical protein